MLGFAFENSLQVATIPRKAESNDERFICAGIIITCKFVGVRALCYFNTVICVFICHLKINPCFPGWRMIVLVFFLVFFFKLSSSFRIYVSTFLVALATMRSQSKDTIVKLRMLNDDVVGRVCMPQSLS